MSAVIKNRHRDGACRRRQHFLVLFLFQISAERADTHQKTLGKSQNEQIYCKHVSK